MNSDYDDEQLDDVRRHLHQTGTAFDTHDELGGVRAFGDRLIAMFEFTAAYMLDKTTTFFPGWLLALAAFGPTDYSTNARGEL